MEGTVIIPFVNKSKSREKNLKFVLENLRRVPELEIIVSVMEDDVELPSFVRKIWTPDTFIKSQAINIGASQAATDIFVHHDADILAHSRAYRLLLDAINKDNYESVVLSDTCTNLGTATFDKYFSEVQDYKTVDKVIEADPFRGTHSRKAPGACLALARSAFIRIGGYCELFQVYGWEDSYMKRKTSVLTKYKNLNMLLFHLPHERHYQAHLQPTNRKLFYATLSRNGEHIPALAERDRQDLLRKYPVFV